MRRANLSHCDAVSHVLRHEVMSNQVFSNNSSLRSVAFITFFQTVAKSDSAVRAVVAWSDETLGFHPFPHRSEISARIFAYRK